MAEGVLHAENAAPAVAQQVEVRRIEAERLAHFFHLLAPAVDVPEVLGRLVAVVTAELVVQDDLVALALGQDIGDGRHVFMGAGRPAMEREDLDVRILPHRLGEDAVAAGQLDHLHTGLGMLGRAALSAAVNSIAQLPVTW